MKYFRDVELSSDPEYLEVVQKPEEENPRLQLDKKVPAPNDPNQFTFAGSNGSCYASSAQDSRPQSAVQKPIQP